MTAHQKYLGGKKFQDVSITNDDGTQYLLLQTIYGEEKIGISWLDKSPVQIKNLIEEYKAGSGLVNRPE